MTSTLTRNTTEITNTALNLIRAENIRIHTDDSKPTVVFSNPIANTVCGGDSFQRTIRNISDGAGVGNSMSVSFTGLLAVAIARNNRAGDGLTVAEVQNNSPAADAVFGKFFSEHTQNLVEYAYHPWTRLTGDETEDERAAANFQRRIRDNFSNTYGLSMGSKAAYRTLVRQILLNINKNNGEFVPAREDYRATRVA